MLMALGHVEGPSVIQVYSISYNVKGIKLYPSSLRNGHVGYRQLLVSHRPWVSVHSYMKVFSNHLLLNENKHKDNQYG